MKNWFLKNKLWTFWVCKEVSWLCLEFISKAIFYTKNNILINTIFCSRKYDELSVCFNFKSIRISYKLCSNRTCNICIEHVLWTVKKNPVRILLVIEGSYTTIGINLFLIICYVCSSITDYCNWSGNYLLKRSGFNSNINFIYTWRKIVKRDFCNPSCIFWFCKLNRTCLALISTCNFFTNNFIINCIYSCTCINIKLHEFWFFRNSIRKNYRHTAVIWFSINFGNICGKSWSLLSSIFWVFINKRICTFNHIGTSKGLKVFFKFFLICYNCINIKSIKPCNNLRFSSRNLSINFFNFWKSVECNCFCNLVSTCAFGNEFNYVHAVWNIVGFEAEREVSVYSNRNILEAVFYSTRSYLCNSSIFVQSCFCTNNSIVESANTCFAFYRTCNFERSLASLNC